MCITSFLLQSDEKPWKFRRNFFADEIRLLFSVCNWSSMKSNIRHFWSHQKIHSSLPMSQVCFSEIRISKIRSISPFVFLSFLVVFKKRNKVFGFSLSKENEKNEVFVWNCLRKRWSRKNSDNKAVLCCDVKREEEMVQ